MADINYIVNQDIPENIEGFEQYSQEDRNLISSFQINSKFDPEKNYSELHILSLSDELLESDYLYNRHRQLGNAQSAGQDGVSVVTIDPIADSKYYGYDGGGIKLLYHFLDDLYTEDITTREFFIQEISPDRTEILLNSLDITQEEALYYTTKIKSKLDSQSYFAGFRLNFKSNDLVIATNIDTLDSSTGKVITVKLYEPLPDIYDLKSTLTVVEIVSDSIAYEVDSEYIIQPEQLPTLKPANFNIEVADESVVPTGYLNYKELFSYPVSNTNNQVYSLVNEKGIDINVDYSDFSDFIHFSSAQERLMNFKYKVELIDRYRAQIDKISVAKRGLVAVTGSITKYEELLTGIVNNFDHYERFLYYESGSSSWPKSNNTKPYINQQVNIPGPIQGSIIANPAVTTWYTTQIENAIYYDNTNYNSLLYSIPTYLRDDENNENYLTFVYMVGQHFDNLWLYSKAVTDKYDADNRPDRGISKDLVAEALKNFGVKLYTSNKSIEDLFTTFTGQAYQSGSEVINHYITGSLTGSNTPIQPTSYDSYQKEVQKRIYHNLPFLLKTKGTERGLRALINCFGISSDILKIKQYGGIDTTTLPFLGDQKYYTSSLSKVRLDNAGSITKGNTLSDSVSILKNTPKYTTDIHAIEVGFSPTDNIDTFIEKINSNTCTKYTMSVETPSPDTYTYTDCFTGKTVQQVCDVTRTFYAITDSVVYDQDQNLKYSVNFKKVTATFSDIDQYLGDPNNLNLDTYARLSTDAEVALNELTTYNLQDYVRLIKFFDNTIFKMVKDFIPARSVATTGIVIKPNLLNVSKAKSVSVSVTQPEYTASIDTAFTTGSDGGAFSTTLPRTYEYNYNNPSCTQYTITILSIDPNQTYKYVDCISEKEVEYSYGIDRTFYAKLGSLEYDSNLATVVEQHVPEIRSYTLQGSNQLLDTSYKDVVQTPQGLDTKHLNWQTNQPLYTGELSASIVELSNGEWNKDNPYKDSSYTFTQTIARSLQNYPENVCGISKTPLGPFSVRNTNPYNIAEKFQIPGPSTTVAYTIKSGSELATPVADPTEYIFPTNYVTHNVTASRESLGEALAGCTGSATFVTQFCDMNKTSNIPIAIESGIRLDLSQWFNLGVNTSSSYSASYSDFTNTITGIPDKYNFYPKITNNYLTASITLQDDRIPFCNTTAQTRIYPTASVAEIGVQDWLSRNLDVTTYTDGTPIPQVTNDTQWKELTTGAWCYAQDNQDTNAGLGKLYNWYALMGIHDTPSLTDPNKRKQLLPSGWTIPSEDDYWTLFNHLLTSTPEGGTRFEWQADPFTSTIGTTSAQRFNAYGSSTTQFQNPIDKTTTHFKNIKAKIKATSTSALEFKLELWSYGYNDAAGPSLINPYMVYQTPTWRYLSAGTTSAEIQLLGIATGYGSGEYLEEPTGLIGFGYYYGHIMEVRVLSKDRVYIDNANTQVILYCQYNSYTNTSSWTKRVLTRTTPQFIAGRDSGVVNKLASTDPALWTYNEVPPLTTIFPNNKTGFGAVTAGWRNMFGYYIKSYTKKFTQVSTGGAGGSIGGGGFGSDLDFGDIGTLSYTWEWQESGPFSKSQRSWSSTNSRQYPGTAAYAFHLGTLGSNANLDKNVIDLEGYSWNYHDGNSIRLIRPTTKRVIIGANKTSAAISSLNVPNTSQMFTLYNLDTTRYTDGTVIPQVTDPNDWEDLTTGAWCYYNNDPASNSSYGKLYNWYAVMGIDGSGTQRSLAPTNYHIPTDTEWTTLTNYLGANAGTKMKARTPWWNTDIGTDESGFRGLPGGWRNLYGEFSQIRTVASWWSATQDSSIITQAWSRNILGTGVNVNRVSRRKEDGHSVRLIKDASAWQIG